jgi:hypothetical protein
MSEDEELIEITYFSGMVGFDLRAQPRALRDLFSMKTVRFIRERIIENLTTTGVHPSDKLIAWELNNNYRNRKPPIGANITFSQITTDGFYDYNDFFNSIVNDTIINIIKMIDTENIYLKHLNNLSIWDTVYGDFNRRGLKRTAPITKEIKSRDIDRGQFHMRY